MTDGKMCSTWDVHVSIQKGTPDHDGKFRPYNQNSKLTVIAGDVARVVELVAEHFPGARIHAIQHRGAERLLYDPVLVGLPR